MVILSEPECQRSIHKLLLRNGTEQGMLKLRRPRLQPSVGFAPSGTANVCSYESTSMIGHVALERNSEGQTCRFSLIRSSRFQ